MMKIGIVVTQWYWEDITSKMLEQAKKIAINNDAEFKVVKVPGSFEIPFATKKLLEKDDINGVVTLGAIIQGSTKHDDIIAHTVAKSITELSLEFNKPVVLGVNGPGMSRDQAIERIERAADVTRACIEMIKNEY
jgi:6,7-dimethyl-8-ribityllumazine synthase